jgi:glycosyltransferase involved in cell wall biosynthesis
MAISEWTKRAVIKEYSIPSRKIEVIPNAVEVRLFSERAKKHFEIDGEPIVLSIHRLEWEKATENLLIAFRNILPRFPRAKLVIVGTGPREYFLKKLTAKLGIERSVIFTGYISGDQIRSLYQQATLFVLPSRKEIFPIVLLEAMASNCPVLATRVGAIPELIKNGVNGLLVKPDNINQLIEAILLILEDPKKARDMARRAYEEMRTKYDWSITVDRILKVYESLLSRY